MSKQSYTSRFDLRVKHSRAGLGLFTFSDIPKNKTIVEYKGNRVSSSSVKNLYIFQVNDHLDIDGSPRWNTARYVNHSCRPNCEAVNKNNRIFLIAKRNIQSGEELTYNYGKEYFDEHIRPKGCRCEKCSVVR